MKREDFVVFPKTQEEIGRAQLKFYNIARFPRIVGAIDCSYIRFGKCPGKFLMFISKPQPLSASEKLNNNIYLLQAIIFTNKIVLKLGRFRLLGKCENTVCRRCLD